MQFSNSNMLFEFYSKNIASFDCDFVVNQLAGPPNWMQENSVRVWWTQNL